MLVWQVHQALAALLCIPFVAHALTLSSRATICNGHAELCARSYGNITYVGAHNSYAVGVNNLATNQDYNVSQQLNDGVRLLQMQAHNSSGQIHLCHTTCALYDGGTLQDYLTTVKTWMDANTQEVVSLLIVNIDNLAASEFASVFVAAGVDKLSYSPSNASLPASGWPTLGSMIDAGTRLVTFMDNTADFTSVPYIIDEFTNIWESAFDVTNVSSFNCSVDRSNADTSTSMFLINHFLDKTVLGQPVPDVEAANTTNAVSGTGSLGAEVAECVSIYGRNPNFLLVDFYEYGGGSVFTVAATANGVQYTGTVPTPLSSSTSSTSTGSSGARILTSVNWTLFAGVTLGAISVFI